MYKYSLFTMACQILISYSISASSFFLDKLLFTSLITEFCAQSQFNSYLYSRKQA